MIKAKIIADSICAGSRITTFELEYPRFIHGELMTHRMFSRNAASSRAIPVDTMMKLIEDSPAKPVEWGMNQSGMQAKELHTSSAGCERAWGVAAKDAVASAKALQTLGLHKQIVNRVLEPFQVMKTVVTATEYANWFYLRNHSDAQPEIHVLAEKMLEAFNSSTPVELLSGEWHLPYVGINASGTGRIGYHLEDEEGNVTQMVHLEDALKISASCCAQVSYRKQDDSLEKALKIWEMLVGMKPVHASPFEHQATPMRNPLQSRFPQEGYENGCMEEGITHMDVSGNVWSGNFKGWIQHRQLIKGHVVS